MMKNTEQDAVRLGEQRQPEGNALVDLTIGLLGQAVCVVVIILIYEAVRVLMR